MLIHMSIDIHWYTLIYTSFLLIYMCFLLIYMSFAYCNQISSQFGWIGVENGPDHLLTTLTSKNENFRNHPKSSQDQFGEAPGIKRHQKGSKKHQKTYSRTSKMEGYFELKCRLSAERNSHVYWYTSVFIDIHQFAIDIHVFSIDIHEFCLL